MKHWPPLLDAAGNEIAVDACQCGRPKEAKRQSCCAFCRLGHSNVCNIRCATLGLRGTKFTDLDRVPGVPVPFHPTYYDRKKKRHARPDT